MFKQNILVGAIWGNTALADYGILDKSLNTQVILWSI